MIDRSLSTFVSPLQPNRFVSQRALPALAQLADPSQTGIPLSRSTPATAPSMRAYTTQPSLPWGTVQAAKNVLPESTSSHPMRTRSSSGAWRSGQGFAALMSSTSTISDSSDAESTGTYKDKHLSRAWDNFWSTHITAPENFARRHIVMTKTYKNCIAAMHRFADEADGDSLKQNLGKLYARCLNAYKGTNSYSETDDLIKLETDLFHTLHNLRFNIFLGDSFWNSAISDGATMLMNGEQEYIRLIDAANSHEGLDQVMQTWFDDCVDFSKKFRLPDYDQARQELRDNIRNIALPASPHHDEPVAARKESLKGLLLSFYDSLTCDISEASHEGLRKWQNRVLPALHGEFLDLQTHPDLKRYETALTNFLSIDQAGAKILGIDLKDLDAITPVLDSVSKFKAAITAPTTSNLMN